MTPEQAFAELLGRIGANKGEAVLVSEEELAAWPDGAVGALKDAGLLSLASPASSVVCPGCEQECSMLVTDRLVGIGKPVLFVVCDKRQDIGRVSISPAKVRQWMATSLAVGGLVARLLGHREQRSPTLEQVKHVIHTMPANSEIGRRNRALIAFVLLTGARDSAIASMKLKHVDLAQRSVFQDARDVKTKFSKTFTTFFFPVGEEVAAVFVDWVEYLVKEKLWGGDDPLFPATAVATGKSQRFEVVGLDRKRWSNATPIRTIFRQAFEGAGVPYFNPHSVRKTLARLGEQSCKTPEEFKAWSQNLGHEQVLTTFTSYGAVRADRQGDIIRRLIGAEGRSENVDPTRVLQQVADMLRRNGMDAALPSFS
jgi:site-specific recombinase XerC